MIFISPSFFLLSANAVFYMPCMGCAKSEFLRWKYLYAAEKTINKSNICKNITYICINKTIILTNISLIYTFLFGGRK